MKTVTQLTLTVAMAGLLVLVSGCETNPAHKQGFDFSHYHTFAIRPLPTSGTPRDPTIVARLGPTARQAVQETLAAKGFKEVPQSEADFQVDLLFDYAPVPEDEFGRHERHMFEIHIIDSKSNAVVWAHWTHRTTSRTMSPEAARKIVTEMLTPFPPGATSH
jgi:hypothetical protein